MAMIIRGGRRREGFTFKKGIFMENKGIGSKTSGGIAEYSDGGFHHHS